LARCSPEIGAVRSVLFSVRRWEKAPGHVRIRRLPGAIAMLGRERQAARALPMNAVMTDSPYKPQIVRVEVTAQWLAENVAKQRAYEVSRRMWTAVFRPSDPRAQPAVTQSRKNPRSPPRKIRLVGRSPSINDGHAGWGKPCRSTEACLVHRLPGCSRPIAAALAAGSTATTRPRWRPSGAAPVPALPPASRCMAGGSSGPTWSSRRWMLRSSTWHGTVSYDRFIGGVRRSRLQCGKGALGRRSPLKKTTGRQSLRSSSMSSAVPVGPDQLLAAVRP
jgi:hypothetical protein